MAPAKDLQDAHDLVYRLDDDGTHVPQPPGAGSEVAAPHMSGLRLLGFRFRVSEVWLGDVVCARRQAAACAL